MIKSLKERINELNEFAIETKLALGIEQYPIEILYGKQAKAYAKANNIKTSGAGFFDYEGKEQPIILINYPFAYLVKGTIRHELTHYKQWIENRLVPVRLNEGKKYFKNISEIEAYKEGAKAYESQFFKRFTYLFIYQGTKLIYCYPITTTVATFLYLYITVFRFF